jgi:arabinogalactan endo-1,4-beta-galactosidase
MPLLRTTVGNMTMLTRSLSRLATLLLILISAGSLAVADEPKVIPTEPPEFGFFSKRVIYEGIPIKAHKDVDDKALLEAHRRITRMLENLPVVVENLVDIGAEMQIIGKDQVTSDLPSQRHWKGRPYESYGKQFASIDERTRGVGDLAASCGEENLLKLPSDRFKEHRDICTHEFAHTMLNYGFSANVREMVQEQFKKSMEKGLWKTAYASTNFNEFLAELSMWYFGSRGDYGKIKPTPEEGQDWLRRYDPDAFDLFHRIYSGQVKVERIAWETLVAQLPDNEGKLRSIDSKHHTPVFIDNRTSDDYLLFWLDFEGKRKPYGTLYAGQKWSQNTFATHPWLIADAHGKALGIYVPGKSQAKIILVDPAEFAATPTSSKFILGADISWVQQQEEDGIRFSDNGAQKDIFQLLKDRKFNWIRLRLFVDPKTEKGYSKKGYCDLPHTVAMAKRIKAAGMGFLIDFHYSDTWADPGKQFKPAAWEALHGDDLAKTVHDYTRDVLTELKKETVLPDMVQIGNEISNGFLWPDGQMEKSGDWDGFCKLLKAGIAGAREAAPSIKIMLHLALGGRNDKARAFLDKVLERGVAFDIIGHTYYPMRHRTLDDLKMNLTDLANRYKQNIIVVECALPRIKEVNDIVHGLPHGKGLGTFYWEPTKDGQDGPGIFERSGAAKPEIKVYQELADEYGRKQP